MTISKDLLDELLKGTSIYAVRCRLGAYDVIARRRQRRDARQLAACIGIKAQFSSPTLGWCGVRGLSAARS